MTDYRYTECGLDNVVIAGLEPVKDGAGQESIEIPNINMLHKAIAESIVRHENSISGKELRFLRTELGMTQTQLGQMVHRDAQSIGRWERGEVAIDAAAEALIRAHSVQVLKLDGEDEGLSVESLSERCVTSAEVQQIMIDGSTPGEYHQVDAA
jgi:DNA-binding transcriptional regulator YiaG